MDRHNHTHRWTDRRNHTHRWTDRHNHTHRWTDRRNHTHKRADRTQSSVGRVEFTFMITHIILFSFYPIGGKNEEEERDMLKKRKRTHLYSLHIFCRKVLLFFHEIIEKKFTFIIEFAD